MPERAMISRTPQDPPPLRAVPENESPRRQAGEQNGETRRAEVALVAALRAGDDGAYERLVRDNAGRMLAVARRFFRDRASAEDAVQDAFLCALRSIHCFRQDSSLTTWLHRIVVNACLMRLRRAKRRHELPIRDYLPTLDSHGRLAGPDCASVANAEDLLHSEESRAFVRAQIDRLPASYRTVLLLRDIEELSTEQVAGLLGISRNAAKIRLHRARQALKTLLEVSRPAA